MFSWKKKKPAATLPVSGATSVVVNGKPDNSKKKKGTGLSSSAQIAKLFGSKGDNINKLGVESSSDRTSGRNKLGFLKSSKKKQAPAPPRLDAPQIVVTDDTGGLHKPDKGGSFYDTLRSPVNVSRVSAPLPERNNDQMRNDSYFPSGLYHNGHVKSNGNRTQNTSNMGLYNGLTKKRFSDGSRLDSRNGDIGHLTSDTDATQVCEYARRPIAEWGEEDVLEWLRDIGLDYFVDMFQDCEIDGEYLLSVTDEDLVDLEVDDPNLRQSLITAISDAHAGNTCEKSISTPSSIEVIRDDCHEATEKKVESITDSEESDLDFSDLELPDEGDVLTSAHSSAALRANVEKDISDDTSYNVDEDDDRSYNVDQDDDRSYNVDQDDDRSYNVDQDDDRSYNVDQDDDRYCDDQDDERSYNVDEDDSEEITLGEGVDSELERIEEDIDESDMAMESLNVDGSDESVNIDTPLEEWGETHMVIWLHSIGLGHLESHFKGHNLTGKELLNVDMQFLDELQVTSADREQLLSHLYELNNPAANIPQDDTLCAINQSSGYERQKFMAAVSVLQSKNPDGVQLLPPDSTPAMAALEENPGSPDGSKEISPRSLKGIKHTNPRSPENIRHTSPRSPEDIKHTSLRSPEGIKHSSPRSPEGKQTSHGLQQGSEQANATQLQGRIQDNAAIPSTEIGLKNTPSSGSEGSKRSDGEEKKKKTTSGLMKLVDAISPKPNRTIHKSQTVQVWTNIGMQGLSRSLSIKLNRDCTAADLTKQCLTNLQLTEDFRLYSIMEVFPSGRLSLKGLNSPRHAHEYLMKHALTYFTVDNRELEIDELPLDAQHKWPDSTSGRLELRKRPAQGGDIKVVFHFAGQKPRGKLLTISLSTPASEVVALGLRKFDLLHADPNLFCLLEVDKFGDLHDVDDETMPLQLDSHAFVLCDRSGKDSAALDSGGEKSGVATDVWRTDSLTSRASSRVSFSETSLTSSHGSSSELLSSRMDDEKLSKLEEEMASIAEALSPRSTPTVNKPESKPSPGFDDQLEKTMQKNRDSIDKDKDKETQEVKQTNTLQILTQQNQGLEEKAKQLLVLKAALSKLEKTYRQDIAESHRRISVPCESDNLPSSVVELQQKLAEASQDICTKCKTIETLKQQQRQPHPTQDGDALQDSLDSTIRAAELDYKLALEETSLVTLQQDQTRLFTRLELALADHQVAIEKGKSRKYRRPLYPILVPSMHSRTIILPLRVDVAVESQHMLLTSSQGQKGIVVECCLPEGDLKVNDRLIEVNGENVTRADIVEVNTYLNKSTIAQVVVLRDQPITLPNTTDLAKMKQQLLLANQQVESFKREKSKMKEEVRRLRPLEHQVAEMTQMKASIDQLQNELAASQNRSEQLAQELVATQRPSMDSAQKDTRREVERLEDEVDELKDIVFRFQESMKSKDSKLASVIHERDAALDRLMENTSDTTKPTPSAMIIGSGDEDGGDLPVWESLKSADKSEILEVLREEVEVAGRQKNYLDQLYTLMLEKAPELLNDLEEDCDISEFSDNEEFC